jgi:quercetin dioxygenase-like cupin family protein
MANHVFILGLLVAAVMAHTAIASDPELTTDFNVTNPNAEDFAFRKFRDLQPLGKGMAKGNPASIPGLSGLGLAAVLFEFGPESQIDPHTHPRATEVFFVLTGSVDVGFVDTNNTLFETTVQAGDIFVFPKGLLHWQRNNGKGTASGFSGLSSEKPGTLFVVKALFTACNTGIPDIVLATALGTSTYEIDNLKQSVSIEANVNLTHSAPSPSGY